MSGLLADIYSRSDAFKRRLVDALRNPKETLQNAGDNVMRDMASARQMVADAADESAAGMKSGGRMFGGPADRRLAEAVAASYSPAGIVSPQTARTLVTAKNLPADDLFQQAVAGTSGAQLVNDGLMLRVQRNQVPDQALRPSVRGGVFYLPEGASQAKHYSTGKSGYGGTERVTGETLISNPMFVKGATGGKAPEAAYDAMLGKGAYEKMRSDARRAYGKYGAPEAEKVSAVQSFLQQYAPELEDQAAYIVKNSKQGNQLAYALQEAAVGSRMRAAGHDAVLGYSKGKQGPFISEVFDVREMNYPDKFGTPTQIWADYLRKKGQ